MTASVSGTTGQMNVEPAPTTGTIVLWTKPPLTYMTKYAFHLKLSLTSNYIHFF